MSDLISTAEAATLAGVAASTLRAYTARGQGPKTTVPGWYRRRDVERWIATRPGRGARTDLPRSKR